MSAQDDSYRRWSHSVQQSFLGHGLYQECFEELRESQFKAKAKAQQQRHPRTTHTHDGGTSADRSLAAGPLHPSTLPLRDAGTDSEAGRRRGERELLSKEDAIRQYLDEQQGGELPVINNHSTSIELGAVHQEGTQIYAPDFEVEEELEGDLQAEGEEEGFIDPNMVAAAETAAARELLQLEQHTIGPRLRLEKSLSTARTNELAAKDGDDAYFPSCYYSYILSNLTTHRSVSHPATPRREGRSRVEVSGTATAEGAREKRASGGGTSLTPKEEAPPLSLRKDDEGIESFLSKEKSRVLALHETGIARRALQCNEELHDLLMYVRHVNKMHDDLKVEFAS